MENNTNNQMPIDQTVTQTTNTEPLIPPAPVVAAPEIKPVAPEPMPIPVVAAPEIQPVASEAMPIPVEAPIQTPTASSTQEPAPIDIPLTRERPIELEPKKIETPPPVTTPTPEPIQSTPKKSNLLFILFIFLLIGGFIYILPNANTIFADLKSSVTNLFKGGEKEPEEVVDNTILKEINSFIADSEYVADKNVTTNINKTVLTVKTSSKNYKYTLEDHKIVTNINPDNEEDMQVFMAVYDAVLQHYGYVKGYADIINVKPLEKGNTGIISKKETDYTIYKIDVSEKIVLPQYIEPETLENVNLFDTNGFTIKRNSITLVKAPYTDDLTTYYIYDSKVAEGASVKESTEVYQTIVSVLKTYLDQASYLEFIKNYSEVIDAEFSNLKIITNYALTEEEKILAPNLNLVVKLTIVK